MVVIIAITNKINPKLLPKQTLFCQASIAKPEAGNTVVIRGEPQ